MSASDQGLTPERAAELARRVEAGEVRAGARLMRLLDDRIPGAELALRQLYPATGRARIIGITGNPGSGKSTLTNQLIRHYRARGERVGVVAVDPSSPYSGGAILGDRIRMMDHAADPDVFIRSLATRGQLGGLSRSTDDVVCVLDAMGYDRILVETVGVGQDEIEIVSTAQTAVVVLVPGLGDDIQAIKAGILEIADIFCVNKADRDGADRTVADLRHLQSLGRQLQTVDWQPPIVRTTAVRGEGIQDLADAIERHQTWLSEASRLIDRMRGREAALLRNVLRDRLSERAEAALGEGGLGERLVADLVARTTDPYTAADLVLERMLQARG